MPLGLSFVVLTKRFSELMRGREDEIRPAALGAMEDLQSEILAKGRENIASAGNFGRRWADGLKGEIKEPSQGNFELDITHDVSYFMVHQKGALIKGKPLLAIPLSFAGVQPGLFARDYPGGLFRVDRAGKAPLLLSLVDRQPKYFLKEQVRIPKRFRVLEIIRASSKKLTSFFLKRLKNG